MCFGGGGSTISVPNTAAYDQQLNAQIAAMNSAMNMGATTMQAQLNDSLRAEQSQLAQLRDIEMQRAETTAAQAQRLANLIGPPPAEENAEAPKLNEKKKRTNKKALRISRGGSSGTSAAGAGLNITGV